MRHIHSDVSRSYRPPPHTHTLHTCHNVNVSYEVIFYLVIILAVLIELVVLDYFSLIVSEPIAHKVLTSLAHKTHINKIKGRSRCNKMCCRSGLSYLAHLLHVLPPQKQSFHY